MSPEITLPVRRCPYCGRQIQASRLVCGYHSDLPNRDPLLTRPKIQAKPVGLQPFATSDGSG